MIGIIEPVVHGVADLPAGTQVSWTNSKIAYDYAIGGLPFLSAASTQFPLTRKTAEYTKQQIDQSTEPGEQTLVQWWLRSQSSFHAGTGIIYEEPTGQAGDTILYRFQQSAGINPWVPGKVTLLYSAPRDLTATAPIAMGATDGSGNDCYFMADGTALKRSDGTSGTTVAWGGTGTIKSLTQDGTNYYAADGTGIYKGALTGGAGSLLWNTGSTPVVVKWVKSRLMAAIGASIYELAGGSPPTLPTPIYTHPNPNWVWTSIAESPSAIYAAGYAGASSAIYMFTLDTSGSVPTLTSGILAAELPVGETISCIYGYLGAYLAIGTNKGCRIADVQADGTVQYGPLSVDFSLLGASGSVQSIVGKDRFLFGSLPNGIDGSSGLFRIDLGTALGYKQFAYATDLQAHVTGDVNSVTLLGKSTRLIMAVAGGGTYIESATVLEPTGYLKTGNIRYHNLDRKLFKFVRAWTKPLTKGAISITVNDHADNPTSLVTFTAGAASDPLDEVAFPPSLGPQEWVSLTIGLTRDADTISGPTLTGYQIKALPAQKRQRTFVLPLLCFDKETDASGTSHGSDGQALTRLAALEAVEEAGDAILFQDLTRHGGPNRLVIIDNIEFVQQAPPKLAAKGSGWGGIIVATLRAVT